MKLAEIILLNEKIYYENLICPWVDPRKIVDINPEQSRLLNYQYCVEGKINDKDPDDDAIVEYLEGHLRLTNGKNVSDIELVKSCIYLINEFWSLAASVEFARWSELIVVERINQCIEHVKESYSTANDWLPKALMRNFCVEFFGNKIDQPTICSTIAKSNLDFFSQLREDKEYTFLRKPTNNNDCPS